MAWWALPAIVTGVSALLGKKAQQAQTKAVEQAQTITQENSRQALEELANSHKKVIDELNNNYRQNLEQLKLLKDTQEYYVNDAFKQQVDMAEQEYNEALNNVAEAYKRIDEMLDIAKNAETNIVIDYANKVKNILDTMFNRTTRSLEEWASADKEQIRQAYQSVNNSLGQTLTDVLSNINLTTNQAIAELQPYSDIGKRAIGRIEAMISGRGTFTPSPVYNYEVSEKLRDINRSLAGAGLLGSTAQLKAREQALSSSLANEYARQLQTNIQLGGLGLQAGSQIAQMRQQAGLASAEAIQRIRNQIEQNILAELQAKREVDVNKLNNLLSMYQQYGGNLANLYTNVSNQMSRIATTYSTAKAQNLASRIPFETNLKLSKLNTLGNLISQRATTLGDIASQNILNQINLANVRSQNISNLEQQYGANIANILQNRGQALSNLALQRGEVKALGLAGLAQLPFQAYNIYTTGQMLQGLPYNTYQQLYQQQYKPSTSGLAYYNHYRRYYS